LHDSQTIVRTVVIVANTLHFLQYAFVATFISKS